MLFMEVGWVTPNFPLLLTGPFLTCPCEFPHSSQEDLSDFCIGVNSLTIAAFKIWASLL